MKTIFILMPMDTISNTSPKDHWLQLEGTRPNSQQRDKTR